MRSVYEDGAKFNVGDDVCSQWQGERGIVEKVEWSVTFGQCTYLVKRTQPSRYHEQEGDRIWICESDLCLSRDLGL